jgi:hypothetical protein
MFKTEYDKRMDRVTELKEQLANQSDVANKAASAVHEQMVLLIESQLAGGDLQKIAGHHGLLKSANANAREHMEVFKRLKAKVIEAQAHANDAFHDHAAAYMKSSIAPVGDGPTFRIVGKAGQSSPLAMPEPQPQSVDPKATLSDVQLGRRFQQ